MANYASHAIMSKLLYEKLKKKKKILNDIDCKEMQLFSLGQDLTLFNRKYFTSIHRGPTKKFFVDTIKYINDNNLQYDSNVMAYLYGHIAHYAMDTTIHFKLYNQIGTNKNKGLLTLHNIIECETDKYLLKKYKCDFSFLSFKKLNNKNVIRIINHTYQFVYNYFNVYNTYKKSLFLIRFIHEDLMNLYTNNRLYNFLIISNKYKDIIDIKKMNVDRVVEISIRKAELMIKYVNKFLYKKAKMRYLDFVFDDSPYDNGHVSNKVFMSGLNHALIK